LRSLVHANAAKPRSRANSSHPIRSIIYLRDSGLLLHLLGIRSPVELQTHPKVGASWEGYAIEEIFKAAAPDEAYFWATHSGAELDLVLLKHGHKFGVECKRVDAPRLTASMRTALDDLQLDQIAVIYPGDRRYPLAERITAVPLEAVSATQTLFPT